MSGQGVRRGDPEGGVTATGFTVLVFSLAGECNYVQQSLGSRRSSPSLSNQFVCQRVFHSKSTSCCCCGFQTLLSRPFLYEIKILRIDRAIPSERLLQVLCARVPFDASSSRVPSVSVLPSEKLFTVCDGLQWGPHLRLNQRCRGLACSRDFASMRLRAGSTRSLWQFPSQRVPPWRNRVCTTHAFAKTSSATELVPSTSELVPSTKGFPPPRSSLSWLLSVRVSCGVRHRQREGERKGEGRGESGRAILSLSRIIAVLGFLFAE